MKRLFALMLLCACATAWAAPKFDGSPIKGEVLESINAGSYTYLRLKTADGEVWAAIMQTSMPPGTKVMIHDPMLMTNFESKALGKTFEQIVFGSAVSTESSGVASPATQMAAAHKGAAMPTTHVPVEKVARATGPDARTVAEVYAQKVQLKGKPVAVRGKVVKFSPGIMDRNWVHLRDGSGSVADASNDLVVTTSEAATVGEVLVVQGTVRTDADFGAGYAYPVVVEGAKLRK